MLSCSCPEYEPDEPGEWWYFYPDDLTKFEGKRRKRCKSCHALIDLGSDCLEFKRERNPWTELEEDICGQEIPIASYFFCERCAEIYLNLTAVGYCFGPTENMEHALEEYWDLTGFKPMK